MAGAGDAAAPWLWPATLEHHVADELAGRKEGEQHADVGGAGDGRGQPADRRGEHGQQHHGRAGRRTTARGAVRGHCQRSGQESGRHPPQTRCGAWTARCSR